MKQIIEIIRDRTLDLVFPRHCPICHKILKNREWLICPECREQVTPIREPYCKKCGKPVKESREYCGDCAGGRHLFTEGRGIFFYNEIWKESIVRYKYSGCREYGDFYGKMLWACGKKEIRRWKPDMIVPVPLHARKLRVRGFNQSEYIADRLSELAGIPVKGNLVKKIRHTRSQKRLDAAVRRKNLREAFGMEARLDGKNILVVDDVYTTGSTMDAMASVLRDHGAEAVFFLTVCIGKDNESPL